MQPSDLPPTQPLNVKKQPQQRHFLITFFFSLMWGLLGIDRMYLGKWGSGLLKLLTVGGFGIWLVVDLAAIINGSVRDAWGRELIGTQEYKKFAGTVVTVYSLVVIAVFVASIAIAGYVIVEYTDGTMFDFKTLLNGGLTPEDMRELGL